MDLSMLLPLLKAVEDGRIKVRVVVEVEATSGAGRTVNVELPIIKTKAGAGLAMAEALRNACNGECPSCDKGRFTDDAGQWHTCKVCGGTGKNTLAKAGI